MTASEKVSIIINNIEKVILGKRECLELVVMALISEGHVLIEDVPGVGKTMLISALAKSIGVSFKRIQFTSDVLPTDITGFSIYNQKSGEFEFRPGAVMSNIILADEINRTSPKTQSSLLEAMEEQQVTVDGTTYKLNKPFMVLATQNPIEYLGTYPLPEAQIDRFFFKIKIGYPETTYEVDILNNFKEKNPLEDLEPVASESEITELQKMVKKVYIDQSLNEYIIKIVSLTRNHPMISLGASVRGSMSLYRAAQAKALCGGRAYVLPDDIKFAVQPVLSHRITLKQEAKLKNINVEDILKEIVESVTVPVVKE